MNHVESWQIFRKNINEFVAAVPEEKMLITPAGLANNMLWIYGHVVRTMDTLVLKLCGEAVNFPAELDPLFAKGSSPNEWSSQMKGKKNQLISVEEECRKKMSNFLTEKNLSRKLTEPYATSMQITLNTVLDTLIYNNIHEYGHLVQLNLYKKVIG